MVLRVWRCWHCGAEFIHARILAGHLIDWHGEARMVPVPVRWLGVFLRTPRPAGHAGGG